MFRFIYFVFCFVFLPSLQGLGDCDFDDASLCGWTASSSPKSSAYKWKIGYGSTDTHFTGPATDRHGSTLGKYVYVDGSFTQQGHMAILTSPKFSSTNGKTSCMCFFYHARGAGIGRLFVKTTRSNAAADEPLAVINGNQGNVWKKECVNILEQQSFQVNIVAESGTSPHGDVAVDDITFTDGQCPVYTFAPGLNEVPNIPNKPPAPPVYGTENLGCFERKGAEAFPHRQNINEVRGDDLDTIKVAVRARDIVLENDDYHEVFAIRHRQLYAKKNGKPDFGDYVKNDNACDDYVGTGGNGYRIYKAFREIL